MQILMLIEPRAGGGFRAKVGEPFNLSAEGATETEAGSRLVEAVNELLRRGSKIETMTIECGIAKFKPSYFPVADERYKTDWVFQAMQEEIAENRRLEKIEEERRWAEAENR